MHNKRSEDPVMKQSSQEVYRENGSFKEMENFRKCILKSITVLQMRGLVFVDAWLSGSGAENITSYTT